MEDLKISKNLETEMNKLLSDLLNNKETIQYLCKDDPLLFGTIFFKNFKRLPHQKHWIKSMQYNKHLQLSPRDHGKSKLFTEVIPLWAICNIPDVRILIASKSSKQSKKYLKNIRDHLLHNQKLRDVYGDMYLPESGFQERKASWTEIQIYTKRSPGADMRDPTVEAIGVLGSITGSHFDYIIVDDPIDDENVKTLKRRESVENWFFGTICQLAEPDTKIFVIGTRKHWDDLFNRILENPVWHATVEKAIIKYPNNFEKHFRNPMKYPIEDLYIYDKEGVAVDVKVEGTYKILAPELWNIQKLLLDRYGSGPAIFEREKQNNPTLLRGQSFNIEWLKYYIDLPKSEKLTFYQGVDIALSESVRADFFVIVTIAVDSRQNIYIVDYYRTKIKFPMQLEAIKTQASIHNPAKIVLETDSYQAALKQQLDYDTVLPLLGVKHTGMDKEERLIRTLSPLFAAGKVYIKENMTELKKEYLNHPRSTHEDILDALEMVCDFVISKQPMSRQFVIARKTKRDFQDISKADIFKIERGRRVFK